MNGKCWGCILSIAQWFRVWTNSATITNNSAYRRGCLHSTPASSTTTLWMFLLFSTNGVEAIDDRVDFRLIHLRLTWTNHIKHGRLANTATEQQKWCWMFEFVLQHNQSAHDIMRARKDMKGNSERAPVSCPRVQSQVPEWSPAQSTSRLESSQCWARECAWLWTRHHGSPLETRRTGVEGWLHQRTAVRETTKTASTRCSEQSSVTSRRKGKRLWYIATWIKRDPPQARTQSMPAQSSLHRCQRHLSRSYESAMSTWQTACDTTVAWKPTHSTGDCTNKQHHRRLHKQTNNITGDCTRIIPVMVMTSQIHELVCQHGDRGTDHCCRIGVTQEKTTTGLIAGCCKFLCRGVLARKSELLRHCSQIVRREREKRCNRQSRPSRQSLEIDGWRRRHQLPSNAGHHHLTCITWLVVVLDRQDILERRCADNDVATCHFGSSWVTCAHTRLSSANRCITQGQA